MYTNDNITSLLFKILTYLFVLLCIIACSTQEDERYTSGDNRLEFPYYPGGDAKSEKSSKRLFPWELWSPTKDMDGLPIVSFRIIKGDEIARSGDREGALKLYHAIEPRGLLPQEREALIFRIASMQLALNRVKDSLHTVSRFFTERNESEENVSAQFSILLGYGYARNKEIDQSLAWFSRAHKLGSYNKSYDAIAESGVRTALRSLSRDELNRLTSVWSEDSFIRKIVGQENEILSRAGSPSDATTNITSTDILGSQVTPEGALLAAASSVPVGLVLPLSGKFAALGRNTKNGIELALSDFEPGNNSSINLVVRDSGGDAITAASQAREMLNTIKPTFFLGPLLTEAALSVSEVARQNGIPMLNFSKKMNFPLGDGIFRLGATPHSQIDTLLSYASGAQKFSKYAVIYSSDQNGQEFATIFRSKVASLGGQILFDRAYNKDDYPALLPIAQELERYQIQAVLFPDGLLTAARFFTNLSPAFRERIKILGTANWDDLNQLVRFQTALNGSIFVSPFYAKSQRPIIQKFIATYRAKYGQEPDFLAAQGFDGATLVKEAVKRSIAEKISIDRALLEIGEYEGLTGKIDIQSSGEIDRSYSLMEFRDGGVSEISVSSATSQFTYHGNEPVQVEN